MPADCLTGRPDLVVDTTAALVVPTTEMNKLPSGGPFIPGAAPTTRPVYISTASITVVDALSGEAFWGMGCGIVRVS